MDGEHATIERDGSVRSGHKGSHMTAPTRRIEVITRGERRRRWSIEEKREIRRLEKELARAQMKRDI